MSSAPTPAEIAADATWLAQAMDPAGGNVRFVAMEADDYRSASFLDDRIFQVQRIQHVVPWESATAGLTSEARADARWIFHIGHVGSTLLSRLIGELPGVLSVREPRILRDLAASQNFERYVPALRQLLSRTFAPSETAVVKATSFASELAAALVGTNGRAIFIYAAPEAYLGTSLAGENTMREVAALAPVRSQRMQDRVALTGMTDRPAYQVAAAWACEMTSLEKAAEALAPDSVQWLNFDRFLQSVPAELTRSAEFLAIEASDEQVAAVAAGPLLGRYSKALEFEYSPRLRSDLIASASAAHATDISGALAMLEAAAQDSPLLRRALKRSAGEG
jgi:hypothetical protein